MTLVLEIFGMPLATAGVFFITLLAGWMAAIHYIVVHVILGKPVENEQGET